MDSGSKYPNIVYKYRNWSEEHHKNVLRQNQLFLTSPKDFNDPFDCRISPDFSLLNTKEKIQQYVDKSIIRQFDSLVQEKKNVEAEIAKFQHRITHEIDKLQQEYENILFNSSDIHYGVLSLSERWNSILMWSHYADCHRGYCIGFWEKKFRESGKFSGGGVHYPIDNNFPKIDPLNDNIVETSFIETHTKSKEWEYEKEYRLTTIFYPEVPTIKTRTIKIPDNFIAEVIIGLKTPKESSDEIISIARNKKIKIFQAKRISFKFEIDREEIT